MNDRNTVIQFYVTLADDDPREWDDKLMQEAIGKPVDIYAASDLTAHIGTARIYSIQRVEGAPRTVVIRYVLPQGGMVAPNFPCIVR